MASLIRLPLPKGQKSIQTHIEALLDASVTLADELTNWHMKLHLKRRQVLWPKQADEKLTEMDRKIRNDADSAEVERDYEFMKQLKKLADYKLDFLKTLVP